MLFGLRLRFVNSAGNNLSLVYSFTIMMGIEKNIQVLNMTSGETDKHTRGDKCHSFNYLILMSFLNIVFLFVVD